MDKFKVKMTGLTPLLMHFDNIEAQDAEHAQGKSGGRAGDDRTPPDRWKSYLYLDENEVVMPSQNVLAALLKVGGGISIGGKKTLKAASQGVLFDTVYLPFRTGASLKPVKRADVEDIDGTFDEQRAAVQPLGFGIQVAPVRMPTGTRHIRTRPMFSIWTVEGTFTIGDADLTLPRLKELFTVAGIKAGLGDWRPGSPKKPGPYGRFEATVKAA